MAVVVKRFTRRRNSYDWSRWMNGKLWRLTQGKDFYSPVSSMRALLYQRARRAGVKVTTSVPDVRTIEFQFAKGGRT